MPISGASTGEQLVDLAESDAIEAGFAWEPANPLCDAAKLQSQAGGQAFKRGIDLGLAFTGLIVLSPVFVLCAGLIALVSPGSVIFSQIRIGQHGRPFRIFKFRTMHKAAPGLYPKSLADGDRMFAVGAWLRRWSFDELPQLINVLRGEMSLVGPRPHMAGQSLHGQLFAEAVVHYHCRHAVLPGMTGWAQVNGCLGPVRRRAQLARRLAHDLYYIENWSLGLDLLILARTICGGFFHPDDR